MTMMVDSGLAKGLSATTPAAPTSGGAPAPSGIAALFATLMGSATRPVAASDLASAAATPAGAEAPPLSATETAGAQPVAGVTAPGSAEGQPVTSRSDTASLASELTTYLDQVESIVEPVRHIVPRTFAKSAMAPVADEAVGPPSTTGDASPATETMKAETPESERLVAGSSPAPMTVMPTEPGVLPSATTGSVAVATDTVRTVPPASITRAPASGAPDDLARNNAAPVASSAAPLTGSPPSDLAAAIAAFAQSPQPTGEKALPTAKPTTARPIPTERGAGSLPPSVTALPTLSPATEPSKADASPAAPSQTVAAGTSAIGTATPSAPLAANGGAPTSPVADIGGMLGQQVIDMGSGGQWIDGLAREIAALGKGDGQGSFRLSPEHLGPMRVDIRAGDQGANVTLTVETKVAEAMLVQDRHLLKADAQLSALRIGEVTVERVAAVSETARADGGMGQGTSSGQSGQQSSQQSANAALSQGQSQNHGHAAANRKGSDAATVSSEAEPRDAGGHAPADATRRARYA
ncbi:flagellar hook-length control protein FliK [Sphingobium algorifonticola]|uniref:Flagellar hook-length control protein FliK n=1 Tax=Sphingobium algorifonticola TaxID=2008318 RepID=A0A437JBT8_9SPHN|nr:flagellar hook-length control protein FliK [Sphingobium algorifonticola]RVT43334.1 flagellar hook-length control protein FliK [Sphingobium algorifonticola]